MDRGTWKGPWGCKVSDPTYGLNSNNSLTLQHPLNTVCHVLSEVTCPGQRIHTSLSRELPPLNPFPKPELLLHQKPGEKNLYARIVEVVRWNSRHHKLWRDPLPTLGVRFWINQSHMVSEGESVLKRCDL